MATEQAPAADQVLSVLARRYWTTVSNVATAAKMTPSKARRTLKKLEAAGKVQRRSFCGVAQYHTRDAAILKARRDAEAAEAKTAALVATVAARAGLLVKETASRDELDLDALRRGYTPEELEEGCGEDAIESALEGLVRDRKDCNRRKLGYGTGVDLTNEEFLALARLAGLVA
jgi:DNA-binding transcriptional ArsR family regulator